MLRELPRKAVALAALPRGDMGHRAVERRGHVLTAFFSYSRANEEVALRIAHKVRASGIALWVDKLDILPGQHWDSEIHAALRRATHVVVLLSQQSVASTQVLDELRYALETGKRVVPVLLEPCDRPPGIIRLQYIDLAKGLEHTLQELRAALEPTPTAAAPAPATAAPSPIQAPVPTPPAAGASARDIQSLGARRWLPVLGVGAVLAIGLAVWLGRGSDGGGSGKSPPPAPAPSPAPVPAPEPAAMPAPAPAPGLASTLPPADPPVPLSLAPLAGVRIDVFWCDTSNAKAEALAAQIRAQIEAGTKAERVRVRKTVYDQGPWASGYEVRVDPDGSEDRAGRALQQFLATRQPGLSFTGWKSVQATPNYLSVFVCPGAKSAPDLEARARHF